MSNKLHFTGSLLNADGSLIYIRKTTPSGYTNELSTEDLLMIQTWLKTELDSSFGSAAPQPPASPSTSGAPSSTEKYPMPNAERFTFLQQVEILKQDLMAKFYREDWHGVADAAMDLRSLLAYHRGLNHLGVSDEEQTNRGGGAIGRFTAGDR